MHWECKMWTGSVIAIAATAARLALPEHRHTVVLPAQHLLKHLLACPTQLDPARLIVLACLDESISDRKAGLGSEFLVLLTQHFILRLLDTRPITVVTQNLEEENGFRDSQMFSQSKPEDHTF